jgi:hypothetical protein
MNLALAVEYGTNESLFLTNLCFWIEKNKANKVHFHDGHYWVYNTMDAWAELFPYFSKDQIRHLIDKMRRKKILLVGVFNRTRYDRTQWYSVCDEVMGLYLGGFTAENKPKQEDASNSPQGQMQAGDLPHPLAQGGKCKWEKSHMDVADLPDRSGESPTPIPYIKPDIKQADAAASKTEKKLKETAAAESSSVKNLKENLYAVDPFLAFDTAFYAKAVSYLVGEGLGETYLSWLYRECRSRKPDNLRGLYFALFFQSDMLSLFREQERKREKEKPIPVLCPVCGTFHDQNVIHCPLCNFKREDACDEVKIKRHRNYFNLPPEEKTAYEEEQKALFSLVAQRPSNFSTLKNKWVEIEKKYHLLE